MTRQTDATKEIVRRYVCALQTDLKESLLTRGKVIESQCGAWFNDAGVVTGYVSVPQLHNPSGNSIEIVVNVVPEGQAMRILVDLCHSDGKVIATFIDTSVADDTDDKSASEIGALLGGIRDKLLTHFEELVDRE